MSVLSRILKRTFRATRIGKSWPNKVIYDDLRLLVVQEPFGTTIHGNWKCSIELRPKKCRANYFIKKNPTIMDYEDAEKMNARFGSYKIPDKVISGNLEDILESRLNKDPSLDSSRRDKVEDSALHAKKYRMADGCMEVMLIEKNNVATWIKFEDIAIEKFSYAQLDQIHRGLFVDRTKPEVYDILKKLEKLIDVALTMECQLKYPGPSWSSKFGSISKK